MWIPLIKPHLKAIILLYSWMNNYAITYKLMKKFILIYKKKFRTTKIIIMAALMFLVEKWDLVNYQKSKKIPKKKKK